MHKSAQPGYKRAGQAKGAHADRSHSDDNRGEQ
jgi:hypothetical protein